MSTQTAISNRQALETKYNNSRSNLLLVVVFTVINIILLATKSYTYFLFSAYIPYALVDLGMYLCGMHPAEYYDFEAVEFLPQSVFYVLLTIAVIFVALYLLSWIFSKNKGGWLIFAMVFFAIDTAGMLLMVGFSVDSIIDILFHAWVILSLAQGISAYSKLKKMPADGQDVPEAEQIEAGQESLLNSGIIRIADTDVKSRVLLETDALGHTVTYRRVKKVNELVIDGKVFDEYEALIETAHGLKARIDGHLIEAGFDGVMHSYVKIDGQTVAKKLRIY